MKLTKRNFVVPAIIFLSIMIAFAPVYLANNYLRQDDLMWEIWPGMAISDFGYLYYNTVFQLVRPLCMLSFYITDLLSIDIQNAVYIRLLSVILLSILAILLYGWQLRFNSNKYLAASFAVASFTLPSYQVFAATGNYLLIITALLLTFGAVFFWHAALTSSNKRKINTWSTCGSVLFFSSLLQYPLSSMYVWVMLFIVYVNSLSTNKSTQNNKKLIFRIALNTVSLMVAYYVISRIFHFVFHVDLSNGRTAVLDTSHLGARLLRVFDVINWHSSFWFWNNTNSIRESYILPISVLYLVALVRLNLLNGVSKFQQVTKHVTQSLALTFLFFFLSYSPVLATPELVITYRYTLATMPILLYAVFWSITILSSELPSKTAIRIASVISFIIFLGTATTGVYTANTMLAEGIVGPHEHDFQQVQAILNKSVIPQLKANRKVVIHAIACDEEPYPYPKGLPVSFEYGMRTCQYQQQVISVIIHSLMKAGYPSNFRRHNTVDWHDNEIVVRDTPWGSLIVNSTSKANASFKQYVGKDQVVVTIDTRTISPYQPHEFYQNILKKVIKA